MFLTYESLVNTHKVQLLLAPSNTARTTASVTVCIFYSFLLSYTLLISLLLLQVSEKYGLINLVVGSQTDSLFKSDNSLIFTSVTPNAKVSPALLEVCSYSILYSSTLLFFYSSIILLFLYSVIISIIIISYFQTLVKKGAKTFTVFMRPDAIAVTTGTSNIIHFLLNDYLINFIFLSFLQNIGAMEYLTSQGLTMIKRVWINVTSLDTNALSQSVRGAILSELMDVEVDVSLLSFSFLHYSHFFYHGRYSCMHPC